MKMLTRRGVLAQDMGQTWLAEPDAHGEEARTLRPLQAAAVERPVIEKILGPLGLDPQPPPRGLTRKVGQAWAH
jgi:hypothetical protein